MLLDPSVQIILPLPSLETPVHADEPIVTEGVGSPVPICEKKDVPNIVTVVPPLYKPEDGLVLEIEGGFT